MNQPSRPPVPPVPQFQRNEPRLTGNPLVDYPIPPLCRETSQLKDYPLLHSERLRRLSREGFWVIFGQTAAIAGGLVGVRLLTELMNPTAYGELALGMTVATLVGQVVMGPLSNGTTRFYAPASEAGDLTGYLAAVRCMVLSATSWITLGSLLMIVCLLFAGYADWIGLVALTLVFALLSGQNSILNGIQNAARQRSIVALHQGMESWARYLGAVVLLIWLGATSTVVMLGYSVAAIIVLGSQYMFFRKIVPIQMNGADKERNWRAQMWNYSYPFAIFGIFTWVYLASDRWALKYFTTTQEVGLYAVVFQLGYSPISMAAGMVMQFLAPIFYQRAGDASNSQRNANVSSLSWRFTVLTLCVTGAVFFITIFFHAQIFRILVAKEYASVSHLLPWMVLAGGVFAAGQTIALNLMSQMKTKTMMAAKITTALLGCTFNFAGAYWYGIAGIVIAGILFSALYFFWMLVLSKHQEIGICFQE